MSQTGVLNAKNAKANKGIKKSDVTKNGTLLEKQLSKQNDEDIKVNFKIQNANSELNVSSHLNSDNVQALLQSYKTSTEINQRKTFTGNLKSGQNSQDKSLIHNRPQRESIVTDSEGGLNERSTAQKRNTYNNPQGGDSESCLEGNQIREQSEQSREDEKQSLLETSNLQRIKNSQQQSDEDDETNSHLNPFSKKRKIHNQKINSAPKCQEGEISNEDSNSRESGADEENYSGHQIKSSNNEEEEADNSGSDFSARDGSPPDFHKNKQNHPNNGRGVSHFSMLGKGGTGSSSFAELHKLRGRDEGNFGSDDLGINSPLLQKELNLLKNNDKYLVPPPEDLIAKSVFTVEPIRTGAPISFVKTDDLKGGERATELMNDPSTYKKRQNGLNQGDPGFDNSAAAGSSGQTRSGLKYLAEEIVKHEKEGKVVYCRFGKQYIINLEKQLTSILNSGTGTGGSGGVNGNNAQLSQAIKSATYLINIKKLIKEHNIDTEYNNFEKLRTKSNVVNKQNESGPALPYYTLSSETDKTLLFESRFESGNLLCATKISDSEYDLVLQNDINTNGHTQWYFFRVTNATKGLRVKFNILNLAKTDSLYNEGMKILAFSSSLKKKTGLGWHRVGYDIGYFQNAYRRENMRQARYYFTFSFSHEFEGEDGDQVYFAHCFPYTYSDLQDDLSRIEKDSYTQNFFYRSTLCRTLAGNKCEYITITSKERDPLNKCQPQLNSEGKPVNQKMGVFLSARVHPGESNASWMMKGLIDFLVSNTPEARVLREKFVFKIVPMINPDGVINGNYRCSLCGSDLNRRWKTPSKVLHPVVFSIKRMVKAFSKEREVALYCDFHGHSRRKNIFMYGNNYTDKPDATRLYPYILSKICDYFSFEYSRFSMHKSKESTARIAMWKELKIPTIYTLEASFSGADKGALKDQHFTTEHLMNCGKKILEALIIYCKIDVQATLNEIILRHKRRPLPTDQTDEESKSDPSTPKQYSKLNFDSLQRELQDNKELLKMTEGKDGGEEGSSGSDSDPSEDNLEEEEMAKIVPIKVKKKKVDQRRKLTDTRALKKKIEEPAISPAKKVPKPVQRSPVKKILLKLRQMKKIEMIDAWTQTSDRGSDNEEAKKLRRTGSQSRTHPKVELNDVSNPTQNLQGTKQEYQHISSSLPSHKQGPSLLPTKNNNDHLPQISDFQDLSKTSNKEDVSLLQVLKQSSQIILNSSSKLISVQDMSSSPQPQIRVRKDKQQAIAASLSKFEEKLLSQNQNSPGKSSSSTRQIIKENLQNKDNFVTTQKRVTGGGVVEDFQRVEERNWSQQESGSKLQFMSFDDSEENAKIAKTPKDRLVNVHSHSYNVSQVKDSQGLNLGTNLESLFHNQSTKINKSPYANNQSQSDSVRQLTQNQNSESLQSRLLNRTQNPPLLANANEIHSISSHIRHYSSENFGGFNMQQASSSNALSNRDIKKESLNQFQANNTGHILSNINHLQKSVYQNQQALPLPLSTNFTNDQLVSLTAVASPKSQSQMRRGKHLIAGTAKHTTQRINNILAMQQQNHQQQPVNQSGTDSQKGETRPQLAGGSQNQNMISMFQSNNNNVNAGSTQLMASQVNQQRLLIADRSQNNRVSNLLSSESNQKRLPRINETSRVSQKNTIEDGSNNNISQSSSNNTQNNLSLSQQQAKNLSAQKAQSAYKYALNAQAQQQLVRNSHIYSLQQSLIKNYGGPNQTAFAASTGGNIGASQASDQALLPVSQQLHAAKSLDRTSNQMSRGGVSSNPLNSQHLINYSGQLASIAHNKSSPFSQQQIQLQNVKMRGGLHETSSSGQNSLQYQMTGQQHKQKFL